MTEYLFAYGLLKKAYYSDPLFEVPQLPVTWVGNGKYQGKLYQVAEYPGVIYDRHADWHVAGDIYEVNDAPNFFKEMDLYEMAKPTLEENHMYVRRKRPIKVEDRRIVECWVYEWDKEVEPSSLIASGNFIL